MSRPRSGLAPKLTMSSVPTGDGKLSAVHFRFGARQPWRKFMDLEKLPAFYILK